MVNANEVCGVHEVREVQLRVRRVDVRVVPRVRRAEAVQLRVRVLLCLPQVLLLTFTLTLAQ